MKDSSKLLGTEHNKRVVVVAVNFFRIQETFLPSGNHKGTIQNNMKERGIRMKFEHLAG